MISVGTLQLTKKRKQIHRLFPLDCELELDEVFTCTFCITIYTEHVILYRTLECPIAQYCSCCNECFDDIDSRVKEVKWRLIHGYWVLRGIVSVKLLWHIIMSVIWTPLDF